MIDNHLQWGAEPKLDPARISWPRVMDMNDRALRFVTIGQGGKAHGVPRNTRFDITPASEVMAILCLSRDLSDLKRRLGEMVVAEQDGRAVRAADFKAVGAMAALLRDAIKPNLVQTLEGNPVLVHGGPFANIAHGCNSVIATTTGMRLADITVTEAGFGADLGAEKFLDIKCRQAGIAPSAAVVVATVRALKLHGGADAKQLATEDLGALGRGVSNLARHIENLGKFGLPVVVAINRFATDTEAEIRLVADLASKLGARLAVAEHFARGGEGAVPLARAVLEAVGEHKAPLKFLYPDAMPLGDKIATIAREIYRAADTTFSDEARARLVAFEAAGFGKLPVCIAKTQYSFSTDAKAVGAPSGHTLHVREARLSAGAGFVVAVCGDILTMPGLPRAPAAFRIDVDEAGQIHGLM
jgi:formate--tetrahydrofolate ligase